MTTDRNQMPSASRRYTLAAAPFLIGAVALYNWVISPHVGYLHAMQGLQPVMDRMVEELDVVSEGLSEKRRTMRRMHDELARVREGLFTREESKAFVHDLQALVTKAGCVLVAADFALGKEPTEIEDPNVPVAIEALHADLTMAGQYEQITSLLQTLREWRRKVWVDSCQIDLVDPRNGRLECRLGLTIYIVRQPGELDS